MIQLFKGWISIICQGAVKAGGYDGIIRSSVPLVMEPIQALVKVGPSQTEVTANPPSCPIHTVFSPNSVILL